MKNILKLFILSFAIFLSSCEDFLDKTPLDTISEADFYKTATDLRTALNNNYQDLPGWAALAVGSSVLPDSYTDMGTSQSPSNRLSGLSYEVPTSASASVWSFDEVREMNWFLDHVDQASGDETEINHYIGEGYFFRAYYYFELLKKYGDLPILDKYFDNLDEEYIYKARDPRNEVVDFMIADLDTAIAKLKSSADISIQPRINKEVAQLFKARVALYEGTWEKYHAGTDFGVDGSDGSAYLQIAADAAEAVIDGGVFSLHSDYGSLFNQIGLKGNSEVMLWRDYDNFVLGIGNPLQISWPNSSAYTRFAVRSYLCTDGDPISVSPLYVGDKDLSTIETNRDPRLAATIMVPGDLLLKDTDGSEVLYSHPAFSVFGTGNTGYASQKYRDPNIDPNTPGVFTKSTSKIIMRYAEALLIFAEAKAELGTISQADLDKSINLLRARVSMPGITLGAITVDPDWPNYGYTLTPILYEIRRERSVELIAEGFRDDDIYRWRAHELFDGDQPRGAYYDDGIISVELAASDANLDADGYLLPFYDSGNYNFDESKAYLQPIPLDELVLNENLEQNPGW
ncbi:MULTISPECIES: RagB/SusD family nutrient uptake outer membrane protein [unclassified Saccharicrinis]|uniref:RagB/SusD family nutrient uptake outer membrane protein n=1 Tax=unclassified Saccharicrinis TaxID=2646859 RepID=UPI003D327F02